MSTLAAYLIAKLRATAKEYVAGDQVEACSVLWTDPDRLWEGIIPDLQQMASELYVLGSYSPEKHRGPALWLRCIEARVVDYAPKSDSPPIFYLPGISCEMLRAAEDCPRELAALIELQYRGVMWLHINSKEWTPYAFLVSNHGGLGLDVVKDKSTLDALTGALPTLLVEPVSELQGRRLDSEFFNGLLAPDATGLLLRWMNSPEAFKQRCKDAEWKAFCEQSRAEFHFDPVKDGPLKAAKHLAAREITWSKVWQRFTESPSNYSGVVEWLKKAAPKDPGIFSLAEVWPNANEIEENALQEAFVSLMNRPQTEVINRVIELESQHSIRRTYPWQKLGFSPLATALEPLAKLAEFCKTSHGAPSLDSYAEFYVKDGWRVDAAAIATMALCGTVENNTGILGALRAIYLPWLDNTSRHLQHLVHSNGHSISKRAKPIETASGRLVLFADGLRMDVAKWLVEKLSSAGFETSQDWEWSAIPSVTATAKPAASPISRAVQGVAASDEFATRLISSEKILTQDRFISALKEQGWQYLSQDNLGDPSGSAWTEAGTLDKRGHNEGWKLSRSVDSEIRDLVSRIGALIKAGWTEIIVVTDHGWLLLPGGLPKVEMKAFLAESRWGRCAALKPGIHLDADVYGWHWNKDVMIACPPGVGCFLASKEYAHGGISLQEMVTPVIRVKGTKLTSGSTHILDAKWTGAKCRVSVVGNTEGVRVDIRANQSDPSSSFLSDKQARETTGDGKVTVFLEDDSEIGKRAEIVLLNSSGQAIHSLPTILGE